MTHSQLPWFVAGPVLGLCVVACRLLMNGRLGVTGGVSDLVAQLRRGSTAFDWRGWFALGIVLAGLLSLLVFGGPTFDGYGWMTETFQGAERVLMVPLLVACGALIGYGAKLSSGCTSGNGLSGNAQVSAGSLVATGTFFATAIVVAFLVEAVR